MKQKKFGEFKQKLKLSIFLKKHVIVNLNILLKIIFIVVDVCSIWNITKVEKSFVMQLKFEKNSQQIIENNNNAVSKNDNLLTKYVISNNKL